jgi:hypothetical protein
MRLLWAQKSRGSEGERTIGVEIGEAVRTCPIVHEVKPNL